MQWLDWLIVLGIFLALGFVAYRTKRYVVGVSDFLAANRCAGPYLLTLADGMAGLGAIGIIASFQQTYEAGLGAQWWGGVMGPIMMLLPLTGFIIYRFRESRVMTIAEFYEKRYSRRFRIFAGILAFVAGVINYGVFPQVTANFLIYFCDIPRYTLMIGTFELDLTLGFVMAVLLSTALLVTFRGGQIAIMVTDFFQAQYLNVIFLILFFVFLYKFGIGDSFEALKQAPEGRSMLNPFDQAEVPDFNIFFYMIGAFNVVYTYMAWQGNQAYNASAKTPHDAKMARILGGWRHGVTWTVILLIPLFAYVLHHSPSFAGTSATAQAAVDALGDEGLQKQLLVPLTIKEILPIGLFGLFVAAMVAAAISTDDTYLHSWGSIFIQDVVMPFRKKRLEPQHHMRMLRRSILGVAIFVWCFGMIFPLREYIFMYWAITGAIYTGGAGSVIIGGFYWKRATAAGAWAGMITGSILAFVGVVNNNVFWPNILPKIKAAYPDVAWLQTLPEIFWLNGMQVFFFASLLAILAYVTVSLLTKPDPKFEMDRLLHRGKYAIQGEHVDVAPERKSLWAMIGVDREYTGFDKFIALSVFVWTIFWFTIFIVGTIYGFTHETTEDQWIKYWTFYLSMFAVVGVITVFWFLWGGFRDLFEMFRLLKSTHRDVRDDGFVEEDEDQPTSSEVQPESAG